MDEKVVQEILSLPHRGSGTKEEKKGFEIVKEYLQKEGIRTDLTPFPCPTTYSYELCAISFLLSLSLFFHFHFGILLGILWYISYFSLLQFPLSFLFDRSTSHNLMATKGNPYGQQVVIMAHLDSAKTALFFHPKIVRYFRFQFLLNSSLVLFTLPGTLFFPSLSPYLSLFFLINSILFLIREWKDRYVEGGNDNLSGVWVATRVFLHLPEDPRYCYILLLTGGEEVGTKGAFHFLNRYPLKRNAIVLNIDSVGKGTLYGVIQEGMLFPTPYPGILPKMVKNFPSLLPLKFRLAYLDTLPFARRGYESVTLIRLKDGVPSHWHWETDRWEEVDKKALWETEEVALNLLKERLNLKNPIAGHPKTLSDTL